MFLRVIRSLDKTIKLNGTRFSRFISQTSPNPIKSRPSISPRPLNLSNTNPLTLSTDVSTSSSMKLPVLKRAPRKKPQWKSTNVSNQREEQYFNVCALATADWYDLDRLKQRLISSSNHFEFIPISEIINGILCIQIRTDKTKATNSEVFIFDDGAVVFWNVDKDHEKLILNEIEEVSDNQYPKNLIN